MNLAAIELARVAQEDERPGIRWSSVFAGMCVGIAVYVLAMLVGVCAGLVSGLMDGAQLSLTALAWNLVSALGAALLGTFVAARSADLRRAADGAMHGLVVWAGAALIVMLVGLVVVRDVASNAMMLMAAGNTDEAALALSEQGRAGMRTADFGGPALRSDTPNSARADRGDWLEMAAPQAQSPLDISAYATLMACAALAISFFGAIAGGLLGTRGPRRDDPLDATDWPATLGDL